MTEAFVDTNIFLYSLSNSSADRGKRDTARGLLRSVDFGLSTQVLQEFHVCATNPHKLGLTPEEASEELDYLRNFPIHVVDLRTIDLALALCRRFRINYWDAAILVAGKALGCRTLYTEDLSHGQDYDGIKVVNPFRESTNG